MRTRRRPPAPVTTTSELLGALGGAGLVSAARLRRLGRQWGAGGDPRPRAGGLVREGVLTGYQAEQVLAGKTRRLRLGPYRILEPLGRGGMGRVYKAEHRLMRRVVALKVIPRRRGARGDGRDDLARFRREVEAAARLSHPHIVTAHD